MYKRVGLMLAAISITGIGAWAQQHGQEQRGQERERPPEAHSNNTPRANQGRVPPPPSARARGSRVEQEHHDNGRVNSTPHVSNDHWYGHEAPNDRRFHIDHAYEHGRFEHFGPSYRYRVVRIDRDHRRFWLPEGGFEVAAWDWALASDWCWDCGDDFAVYEDPDHAGWYLLYNVHTGGYVHVTYLGT